MPLALPVAKAVLVLAEVSRQEPRRHTSLDTQGVGRLAPAGAGAAPPDGGVDSDYPDTSTVQYNQIENI